jgi:glutaredoxin
MRDAADSPPRGQPPAVVLYKKAGCHLCDVALELLESERKNSPFTLGVRDITNDPILLEQYGTEVPVVFIDGRKRFFGKVDPMLLRRALGGS